MAVRFAVASGNWSNPAIWDNGAVPVAGDDVYANGFNVTINQNINQNISQNIYLLNTITFCLFAFF